MSDTVSFSQLMLPEAIVRAVTELGYETPSPIQAAAIPKLLAGEDVLGQAQTGTGKTGAFALPLLARLDPAQNDPQILVLAPTRELAIQVAEAFQGIIRNIWSRSSADEATDWAIDCAVSGGIGFIRVLTEYVGDESFDQDIVVKRVRNPLSVLLDPECQMADGSDARYAFLIDEIPTEDFKRRWPKAKETDWDSEHFRDGWGDREVVRVCEYFYVEEEEREVLMLSDGSITTQTALDESKKIAKEGGLPYQEPEVVRRESRPKKAVKWMRMTGGEVLDKQDWLGKYIPLVPVYGEERDVDGKWTVCSLIHPAIDAQRLYNYSRSAFAERVALTPKAPWLAAAGQVENFPEWKTANTGQHSVLRYDPIDVNGQPLPPPSRISLRTWTIRINSDRLWREVGGRVPPVPPVAPLLTRYGSGYIAARSFRRSPEWVRVHSR